MWTAYRGFRKYCRLYISKRNAFKHVIQFSIGINVITCGLSNLGGIGHVWYRTLSPFRGIYSPSISEMCIKTGTDTLIVAGCPFVILFYKQKIEKIKECSFAESYFFCTYEVQLEEQTLASAVAVAISSSINPCPFDLQKNLTVPSCTSSSILPFIEIVLVLLVMMMSGNMSPCGIPGDPGEFTGEIIISLISIIPARKQFLNNPVLSLLFTLITF